MSFSKTFFFYETILLIMEFVFMELLYLIPEFV
ncbi:hypothetical protein BFAG_01973 [Bacteroides fragilis 3_1_12]|uniref:NADH dehydrogenase subunit 3 n=1 Tax=Bacteroides fragilis 3_1_12 TaxID=457424 RepID=A0ABN0BK72_BACFG|nr:hypothetical protein BFAG_01973 [Bacteroides fragilis 3_1_12]